MCCNIGCVVTVHRVFASYSSVKFGWIYFITARGSNTIIFATLYLIIYVAFHLNWRNSYFRLTSY
jgi:hypothetical protein